MIVITIIYPYPVEMFSFLGDEKNRAITIDQGQCALLIVRYLFISQGLLPVYFTAEAEIIWKCGNLKLENGVSLYFIFKLPHFQIISASAVK
jgi:hypothetical protein